MTSEKEWHSEREEADKQQPPPDRGGRKAEQEDSNLTAADHTGGQRRDDGWGAEWSEDVERTYDAPPPLGLTDVDLGLYRRLVRYSSRGGIIPSQETLARELGVSVSTVKRSVARLKAAGWLETSRRDQRNARRGGWLKGGNRYHPKVSLNDLDEGGLFPQVATRGHRGPAGRNEGSAARAASPQVTARDHDGARSLVDGEEKQHQPRSQRGITGEESPPSTPTVSESKPVEERVSSRPSAQQLSAPGGRRFRTIAEEKAWVAAQPRPPPQLDDDIVGVLVLLQEAGMLETARVVKVERAT